MMQLILSANAVFDKSLVKSKSSNGKLVPVQKQVMRDGKVFTNTYWVSPEEAEEIKKRHNEHGPLDYDKIKELMKTKDGKKEALEMLKNHGIKWDEVDHKQHNWLKANKALREHVKDVTGDKDDKKDKPKPKVKDKDTAKDKTDTVDSKNDNRSKVNELAKDLGGNDKLMEEMKKRGIKWDEASHPSINNMRAKMALKKFLDEGGNWDGLAAKTDTKDAPVKDTKNAAADKSKDMVQKLAEKYGGNDKLIDEMRKRGIQWNENGNPNINNMRAKMALKKHFDNGNIWHDNVQQPEPKKQEEKPVEKQEEPKSKEVKEEKKEEKLSPRDAAIKKALDAMVPEDARKCRILGMVGTDPQATKYLTEVIYAKYEKEAEKIKIDYDDAKSVKTAKILSNEMSGAVNKTLQKAIDKFAAKYFGTPYAVNLFDSFYAPMAMAGNVNRGGSIQTTENTWLNAADQIDTDDKKDIFNFTYKAANMIANTSGYEEDGAKILEMADTITDIVMEACQQDEYINYLCLGNKRRKKAFLIQEADTLMQSFTKRLGSMNSIHGRIDINPSAIHPIPSKEKLDEVGLDLDTVLQCNSFSELVNKVPELKSIMERHNLTNEDLDTHYYSIDRKYMEHSHFTNSPNVLTDKESIKSLYTKYERTPEPYSYIRSDLNADGKTLSLARNYFGSLKREQRRKEQDKIFNKHQDKLKSLKGIADSFASSAKHSMCGYHALGYMKALGKAGFDSGWKGVNWEYLDVPSKDEFAKLKDKNADTITSLKYNAGLAKPSVVKEGANTSKEKAKQEAIDKIKMIHQGNLDELNAYNVKVEEMLKENSVINCLVSTAKDNEVSEVKRRIAGDWDSSNHHMKHTVLGVYQITGLPVEKEFERLKKERGGSRKFYHGTGTVATTLILGKSGQFRVPKTAKVGRMLGDGVYLADKSSKAAQYINDAGFKRSGEGSMMLCEAALGKITSAKGGSGDTVEAIKGTGMWSNLINNEWCVRTPEAVLPKTLVHIKTH